MLQKHSKACLPLPEGAFTSFASAWSRHQCHYPPPWCSTMANAASVTGAYIGFSGWTVTGSCASRPCKGPRRLMYCRAPSPRTWTALCSLMKTGPIFGPMQPSGLLSTSAEHGERCGSFVLCRAACVMRLTMWWPGDDTDCSDVWNIAGCPGQAHASAFFRDQGRERPSRFNSFRSSFAFCLK